jgi:hypothetical protein
MNNWSLSQLLAGLHDDIEQRLSTARKAFGHPGTKGDASEGVWLELLETYLPRRYQAAKAHVVDSRGAFSEQIDVLIFDRQYSPFIFNFQDQMIVPAESVYAAFEAKQTINADDVAYAARKIGSVRKLYRTSLPIPYADGTYPAKEPPHIIGGLVSFESDWKPGLGKPLVDALMARNGNERLDMGCVAAHGIFCMSEAGDDYTIREKGKPATAFLLELIARLQGSATVPMIDIRAYAQWLDR